MRLPRVPKDVPASWLLVSFATLIYWTVPQSMRMLFSIRLNSLGASELVIGIVVAGAAAASLALAVPSGYVLDRLDARATLLASMTLLGIITGTFAVTDSILAMSALMVAQAVMSMWVWLILQAGVTRVGTNESGQWHLNVFSLAWGIGMAAGPAAAAWVYDAWGFETLCVSGAALTMAGALTVAFTPLQGAATKRKGERGPEDPPGGLLSTLRKAIKDPVVTPVMVASFITLYVLSLRISFYPVYLEVSGVSLSVIGILMSIVGVASLAIRLVLPVGIRAFGNRKLLMWSTWFGIVGIAVTPLAPLLVPLVLGALLIGVSLGSSPPITLNLLAGSSHGAPGVAMGLRLVANRAGQVVQPLVVGAVAAASTLAVAFPVSAGLLGLTAMWMGRRLRSVP